MIIFNNGPGTKIGIQAATAVIVGGVVVTADEIEAGDVSTDDDETDE